MAETAEVMMRAADVVSRCAYHSCRDLRVIYVPDSHLSSHTHSHSHSLSHPHTHQHSLETPSKADKMDRDGHNDRKLDPNMDLDFGLDLKKLGLDVDDDEVCNSKLRM